MHGDRFAEAATQHGTEHEIIALARTFEGNWTCTSEGRSCRFPTSTLLRELETPSDVAVLFGDGALGKLRECAWRSQLAQIAQHVFEGQRGGQLAIRARDPKRSQLLTLVGCQAGYRRTRCGRVEAESAARMSLFWAHLTRMLVKAHPQ
jgi:hypothetical protein